MNTDLIYIVLCIAFVFCILLWIAWSKIDKSQIFEAFRAVANWIIKKLGGYTEREYREKEKECEQKEYVTRVIPQVKIKEVPVITVKGSYSINVFSLLQEESSDFKLSRRIAAEALFNELLESGLIEYSLQDNTHSLSNLEYCPKIITARLKVVKGSENNEH